MTHQLHRQSNHRFAWLTPVRRQSTGTGRWMLCENDDSRAHQWGANCTYISENALLQMLATAFDKRQRQGEDSPSADEHKIFSQCGQFEARLVRQENNPSRLFVQQRDDYFARLELYINDQLVVAYQEPVWPHLQAVHSASGERLRIPQGCITLLEQSGASRSGENLAANSDNCDQVQGNSDIAAA